MASWRHTAVERNLLMALVLLLGIGAAFFFHANRVQKERAHFSEQLRILETAFNAGVQTYRLSMQGFYETSLNTEPVLALVGEAGRSRGEAQDLARGRLYRALFPVFEAMRRQNLRQLHFHLPDGSSLLRFYMPERYGNSLLENRPLVRRVLEPAQWLPADAPKDAFPAHREIAAKVAFEAPLVAAAGYRVWVFYP